MTDEDNSRVVIIVKIRFIAKLRFISSKLDKFMEIKETSDSKMAEFMMDGAIFTITRTIIGTVRQVFIRFSDGRSGKWRVQEQD